MKRTLISGLLIAGLLLPGAAVSQKFTLRTETEVVLVNVSVSDRDGNFVRDVKKEDFTISEDGKKQEIVRLQASLGAATAAMRRDARLFEGQPAIGPNGQLQVSSAVHSGCYCGNSARRAAFSTAALHDICNDPNGRLPSISMASVGVASEARAKILRTS